MSDLELARTYDERWNLIEWAYYGINGNPVLDKTTNSHKVTAAYDERGNRVEEAYFDINGKPMLYKDGYHRLTNAYDARGNTTKWVYYGVDGKPVLHKDGYHQVTASYNDQGKTVKWTAFGIDGEPMLFNGYHQMTTAYDERGNRVGETYYDAVGKPISTLVYDAQGNQTGADYFNYSAEYRERYRYDERDNLVSYAALNAKGIPVLNQQGFAKYVLTYDASSQLIDGAFYDAEGQNLETAVVIVQVESDSQASILGLRAGDTILSYRGQKLRFVEELVQATAVDNGERAKLVVARGRQLLRFTAASGRLGVTGETIVTD